MPICHQQPRSLASLLTATDALLDRFMGVPGWQWRVVWSCLLFSVVHMVLMNPSCLLTYQAFFKTIGAGQEFDVFAVVKAQAATFYTDLGFSHFRNAAYESQGHHAKMQYRLLEPALVATFGIRHVSLTLWLVQLVLSLVFIWLTVRLVFRHTANRGSSFLFTLALSLLYPVRAAWLDMTAYGDFFAYLFLLIATYSRQPLVVGLVLQAAFWTDERALLGAGFVWLWHLFAARLPHRPYVLNQLQVAVFASYLLYAGLRLWCHFIQPTDSKTDAYLSEFKAIYYENIKLVGFKVWSGFQGGWLLVGASAALLVYNRRFLDAALLLGLLGLTVNLGFIVGDVNRAISYSYIALFCAFLPLSTLCTATELRRVFLVVVASLLIAPLPNRLRILKGIPLM